ncbi:protein-arginine deiminase family protein [Paractinoplanes lichenicola]|uniref:Protein-arginine deiminase C-terminal domain-containing protein n=1 Tax=Paractinoplanes lichenicola TaxID=2802976 RepID=A0ABS1VFR3_9ACTN|nr:protein-arginine deiminase family protein [Actinoplanes lichenicola]MBL7253460.1 hypothetical protein [Actinoplanes lichenicola]
MRRRHMIWLSAGVAGVVLAGVPLVAFAGAAPVAGLQALSAVFLANLDDDANACRTKARTIAAAAVGREEAADERFQEAKDKLELESEFLALRRSHRIEQNQADRQLAACNDAADTVVNGAADELDLTRLRVGAWPDAPADATATLTTTGKVRLFVKRAGWQVASTLGPADLRRGVQLGLEGTDVVRDRTVWDGGATVTLRVTAGGRTTSSLVRLKEAPVLTQLNTAKLQRVLTTDASDDSGRKWRDETAEVLPEGVPLTRIDTGGDEWMQDLFEPAYQVMPGPDGKPHGQRVLVPTVNDLHRQAARITYTELRGPDVAVVHVPGVPVAGIDDMNTYDSMGNLETMPPTPGHPHGTIVVGNTPSREILTFFRSQGAQQIVTVDTGWLTIGHVDEFIQFLPYAGGWRAIVADPTAGLALLSKAPGTQKLHGGLPTLEWPYDGRIDQRTIAEFRADKQFVDTNRIAAARIAANVGKLGLTPDRIVRVPVLFTARSLDWAIEKTAAEELPAGPARDKAMAALNAMRQGVAETPNVVNGLVVNAGRYVAPTPYGPLVNGRDLFADATSAALNQIGYQVTFVDDLISAHVSEGEIHCSTNTFRAYP